MYLLTSIIEADPTWSIQLVFVLERFDLEDGELSDKLPATTEELDPMIL